MLLSFNERSAGVAAMLSAFNEKPPGLPATLSAFNKKPSGIPGAFSSFHQKPERCFRFVRRGTTGEKYDYISKDNPKNPSPKLRVVHSLFLNVDKVKRKKS